MPTSPSTPTYSPDADALREHFGNYWRDWERRHTDHCVPDTSDPDNVYADPAGGTGRRAGGVSEERAADAAPAAIHISQLKLNLLFPGLPSRSGTRRRELSTKLCVLSVESLPVVVG